MKLKFVTLIWGILSLYSCKGQEVISEPIPEVSFSDSRSFIKDHFRTFHCFQLELNDECAIPEIRSIQDVNGELYVLTNNDLLLVFNRTNGRYIRKIGSRGEGPAEYLSIKDFFFTQDQNQIGIVDGMAGSIKYYSTAGKFDHEVKLDKSLAFVQSSEALSDDQLLFSNEVADPSYSGQNAFMVFDLKQKNAVLDFDNFNPVQVKGYSTPFARKPSTRSSGGITFFKFLNDTIFHISKDDVVSPIYKLKFNMPLFTREKAKDIDEAFTQGSMFEVSMKKGYVSGLDKIYETRELIALFPFSAPYKDGTYFIDKKSGKGYHIQAPLEPNVQCKNILELTDFPDFLGSRDDELICVMTQKNIAEMKTFLRKSSMTYSFKELETVVDRADIEGNPILVFYEH